jgi:hypothetical protein
MIKNYYRDEYGVIHQSNITEKVTYDNNYIETRYLTYKEKCVNMSYLRLGYIVGTLGYIPQSILDVGYGSGDFLNVCKNIIPSCYGNDVTNILLPENVTFVDDVFNSYYEVITFFDVLEHFKDISIIKNLQCRYIVISVPWCHYFSDEWFETWKHRRPNEHLHHFDKKSLIDFFTSCGYSCINSSCVEDTIRKDGIENILTCTFKNKSFV